MDVPFPRAAWRFLISFLTLNISICGMVVGVGVGVGMNEFGGKEGEYIWYGRKISREAGNGV